MPQGEVLVDGIDLYVEQLDRENGRVRNPEGFRPCQTIRERYTVKGQDEPFEEDLWITPRGPNWRAKFGSCG